MIEPHIKPDAPGTQPGDVGNGRVLVLNERQQKFLACTNNKRYCSDKCRIDHLQTLRQRLCTCVVCGKIFPTRRNNPAMTCSDKCAQVVSEVKMPVLHSSDETDFEPTSIRSCPICGQRFAAQPSE